MTYYRSKRPGIYIRFTDEEMAKLKKLADAKGVSKQEVIRMLIMGERV